MKGGITSTISMLRLYRLIPRPRLCQKSPLLPLHRLLARTVPPQFNIFISISSTSLSLIQGDTYYTRKHSLKALFSSLQPHSIEIVRVLEHSTKASIWERHSDSALAFCCFISVSASRLDRIRCGCVDDMIKVGGVSFGVECGVVAGLGRRIRGWLEVGSRASLMSNKRCGGGTGGFSRA